jgi:hypothetical protein
VAASEFTVSFTLPGYETQTVPVRVVASTDPMDADAGQTSGGPRLVPNPVFVELTPAAPPPAARRRSAPSPAQTTRPRPRPAPPPPTAMAPAPAPAPASPWPPPR